MSSHTGQSPTCPSSLSCWNAESGGSIAQQLTTYLTDNGLLPDLQSAYRTHHSTETAVLKVVGDILLALDSGNLALLSLLDLSAAFDTVNHYTLLRRLQTSYGLDGVSLNGSRHT